MLVTIHCTSRSVNIDVPKHHENILILYCNVHVVKNPYFEDGQDLKLAIIFYSNNN